MDKYINKPLNGDAISGENRAVNFITCLFQNPDGSIFSSLEKCTNQKLEYGDYMRVREAIKTDSDLLKKVFGDMRDQTKAIADANGGVLPRVPTVTVNGQLDYNALDDLVQEACAQYTVSVKLRFLKTKFI